MFYPILFQQINADQLHDNMVILQEVVHSMQNKRLDPGWMVVKIDLEKTYDRVSWDFY